VRTVAYSLLRLQHVSIFLRSSTGCLYKTSAQNHRRLTQTQFLIRNITYSFTGHYIYLYHFHITFQDTGGYVEVKVTVKQSHYRPGHALCFPGSWGCHISYEAVTVDSPMYGPHLLPRKYSWYSFLLESESAQRTQRGGKDYVNGKFQWHHRESNARSSDL